MAGSRRVSVSLPAEIVDDLDYISKRLGVSRSAFLAQLLSGVRLDFLRSLVSSVPEQPTEGDARRFRGESKAFIAEQLEQLQAMQGGLFDDSAE